MIIKFITNFFIFLQFFKIVSSDCVIYGECNVDSSQQIQNCPYTGPPKPLYDLSALRTLREYCPHIANGTENPLACCDAKQLHTFEKRISVMVALVSRCPSCFQSVLPIFCDLMCHPQQSKYVNVTRVLTNINGTNYVESMELFVNEEYLNGTYNSCKQVMMPTTGQLILDLMCGNWGAEKCTAKRLYKFLGTKSEQVPFNMNFITSLPNGNSSFELMNPPTYPCYKAINNLTPACSCIDCEESCPAYSNDDDDSDTVSDTIKTIIDYYDLVLFFVAILLLLLLYRLFPLKISFYMKQTARTTDNSNRNEENRCRCTIPCNNKFEKYLSRFFTRLGRISATHPKKVILAGIILTGICMFGVQYIDITIDPVELWTSNGSRCRQERQFFNENFGPFYRIEHVIVTAKNENPIIRNISDQYEELGPVFDKQFLLDFKRMQDDILELGDYGLRNICFAPLANRGETLKNTKKCLVLSVWGYFKNDKRRFNREERKSDGTTSDYVDHIKTCTRNSYNPLCLAEYGGPVEPAAAFGSFLSDGEVVSRNSQFVKAKSLVLTILVQNHLNKSDLETTLQWEQLFVDYMESYKRNKSDTLRISYYSERSIEDEVNRESEANASIVVISYAVMFIYITLTLGRFHFLYQFFMESKIIVGLGGVITVFSSVIASIGINSYFGISVTLVVLEVVPFLVLAVGVDNIFILVHAFEKERFKNNQPLDIQVGRVLGERGPSILLTSASESGCFLLGALSSMPCIKAFALYAAVALVINFILQLTCFVSLLSLDYKRRMAKRMDVLCCIKVDYDATKSTSTLNNIFEKYYTPFILHRLIRPLVLVFFTVWLITSAFFLPNINIGFDQDVAMPKDSYLLDYFKDLQKNLAIGPPVYFMVTNGMDLANTSMQNILCSGQYCDNDSITNQIYAASKNPNKTYISKPSSSWIDDYFLWFKAPGCCLVDVKTKGICTNQVFCEACHITFENNSRPSAKDFNSHLSEFLSQTPTLGCVKGGKAAYGQGVKYRIDNETRITTDIGPYYFMAYHSVLKTSYDFYTSLKEARNLADKMTETIKSKMIDDVEVIPYSIHYIFFEQYLTIWKDSIKSISVSLIMVFFIVYCFTFGNLTLSSIILYNVMVIVVNMLGLIYFLDIQLNALSLVNIIMSIGIAVEFCGHIATHFHKSEEKTNLLKSKDALNNIGPSVLSGITTTKFIGISVLWFSNSDVFRIYFFQMYMGVVLIGAMHGLIFMPVLLSYFGSSSKQLCKNNNQREYEIVSTQETTSEKELIKLKSIG